MSLSDGSRNFLRYGYGDLLREGRKYAVLHRIWAGHGSDCGLWGDPLMAAAYGRASSFSGSDGVEWMEPLSFKGRKGSGLAGNRDSYAGVTASRRSRIASAIFVHVSRLGPGNLYNLETAGPGCAERRVSAADVGCGRRRG